MAISDQERMARSLRAKAMHADGRLGNRAVARKAAARSTEVRRERASNIAQQLVTENREQMERFLRDLMKSGTTAQKLKATELLLKSAMAGERIDAAENRDAAQNQSREELIATLAAKLSGPSPAAAAVRARLAETVDGTAVEL